MTLNLLMEWYMATTLTVPQPRTRLVPLLSILTLAVMVALTPIRWAAAQKPATPTELQRQVTELKAQVAKLQAAVADLSGGTTSAMGMAPKKAGGSMGMTMDKGEMGMPPEGMMMKMPPRMMEKMEKMDMMEMGAMKDSSAMGAMSKATPDTGMTGMLGAGMTRTMSSLPGFPGLSHLYHIGATGFFLDQVAITLTVAQQEQLNEIRTRALLLRSESDRRVAQLEEELWTLTADGEPDATKIEAKIQDIERARANARMAFIRAVGDATKMLSQAQRQQLLGTIK